MISGHRYLIHSHDGRMIGRKNPLSKSSSFYARSGGSARFQGSKGSDRIDISESWVNREYIAPVQGSLSSKRGEIEDSRARKSFLGGSPQIFAAKWWISKDRAGFLRNNREIERTLHQGFGVAQKDGQEHSLHEDVGTREKVRGFA